MSDKPETVALAERLRIARARSGLEQTQIAERLGVSLSTYSGWERLRSQPRATELAKLARIYGVSADYLVGISDHEQGMRPGYVMVDEDAVERWMWAADKDVLRKLIHSTVPDLGMAVPIPPRVRLYSPAEWKERHKEIAAHAAKLGLVEVGDEPPAEG